MPNFDKLVNSAFSLLNYFFDMVFNNEKLGHYSLAHDTFYNLECLDNVIFENILNVKY